MSQFEKPAFRKYYPVPPMYDAIYEYQDLNKDLNLRNQMTMYYHNKSLHWFKHYPELIKKINSSNGHKIIYKLLRKYVKHYGINWYDLIDYNDIVKNYFYKHYHKNH